MKFTVNRISSITSDLYEEILNQMTVIWFKTSGYATITLYLFSLSIFVIYYRLKLDSHETVTTFMWNTDMSFSVCAKRITLCNCLCSSSCCFSASVIRNIGEFGAKNYFTDHQTANTIHCFRHSVPVLKIYDCY